ncbi:hypothetical protein PRVXH_001714 [Proteinivorax hydrogeniformans]|uniref:CNNM transmembrane domain-containing protein n=1 Tax=Proteinivorax hydrogeniformans TaxID=1826727 RepID=A0AAU8HRG8_9FIRM
MVKNNLWIAKISLWTFVLAVIISIISQIILGNVGLVTAFLLLFSIIFLGVLFDTIGVATTAAKIPPLAAKSAKRVKGAKQALRLIRNAEQVATFFNDVVGDISGIISGGAATVIVFILVNGGETQAVNVMLTALVAALTVGGKGIGKTLAIHNSTEILMYVGKVIYYIEKIFRVEFFKSKKNGKGK